MFSLIVEYAEEAAKACCAANSRVSASLRACSTPRASGPCWKCRGRRCRDVGERRGAARRADRAAVAGHRGADLPDVGQGAWRRGRRSAYVKLADRRAEWHPHARRRLARGPLGVQRGKGCARDRGARAAHHRRRRPRDRLHDCGLRRGPARADTVDSELRGAGPERMAHSLRAARTTRSPSACGAGSAPNHPLHDLAHGPSAPPIRAFGCASSSNGSTNFEARARRALERRIAGAKATPPPARDLGRARESHFGSRRSANAGVAAASACGARSPATSTTRSSA